MKKIFLLLLFFSFLISPLVLYRICASKKTLYVYSWSAYIKPEIIEKFQKEFDCVVVLDTYDSNEAMFTKLKLGGAGYDLLFPSSYFLEDMIRADLLMPFDEAKIPNLQYVDWSFLSQLKYTKSLYSHYAVPFMVSFSGVAWRTDRIHKTPDSWSIFGDDSLSGRMTMLNDLRETLGAALLYLGYSVNTVSAYEIEQAQNQVILWKKNLVKFESEQYKNGIASAEYLAVHGYSGDCLQLSERAKEISFYFPKEGSIASIDTVALMKGARNIDLAHAFINFLHDPHIASENMEYTHYRCLNSEAKKYLSKKLQFSKLLYPEISHSNIIECLASVGPARKHYVKAWNAIKEKCVNK